MNCMYCGYEIVHNATWETGYAHQYENAFYFYCDNPVKESGRARAAQASLIRPQRVADLEFEQVRLI